MTAVAFALASDDLHITMADTQDNSEFLDGQRLETIGRVNSVLLHEGGYWIHRRKESVTVIDETAVQRTVSVDFTLPERIDGQNFDAVIQRPYGGEPVYCPPLFVLPKASNELMSFDLRSESGVSLPLMTRRDNARVSAVTLTSLAERVLGQSASETLEKRLSDLAVAETVRPVAAERLLQAGKDDPDFEQLQLLCRDGVFKWWLWTLAHSSLVGVPFRDPNVRRKIFVLSYIESFVNSLRVRTRLGWAPYKVVIDSSWIGARNFHFEAEAPPGLRIAKAILAEDDEDAQESRPNSCLTTIENDGPSLMNDEVPALGGDGEAGTPKAGAVESVHGQALPTQEEAWASEEDVDPAPADAEISGVGSRTRGSPHADPQGGVGASAVSVPLAGLPTSGEVSSAGGLLWQQYPGVPASTADVTDGTGDDGHSASSARFREPDPNREVNGLLRRVHLSRYEASRAGASTATLDLRVNGSSFIGGALLACGLVVAAILSCLIRSESIAKNPTSAPAVLLLLPGMIATYVGRPDWHALTTRLLLFARWLLLLAGLAAYSCAAFVALGGGSPKTPPEVHARVTHLKLIFWIGSGVAVACFAGLALGWLLANPMIRSVLAEMVYFRWVPRVRQTLKQSQFVHSLPLPLSGHALREEMKIKGKDLLNLKNDQSHRPAPREVPDELAVFRLNQGSTWTLRLQVTEANGEAELRLLGTCLPRLLLWPMRPLLVSREARAAGRRLKQYEESLKLAPAQRRRRLAWLRLLTRTCR